MSNSGPDPNALVASTLVRLMRSREITTASLAGMTKIDARRLGAILEGEKEATVEDLLRLAGAFGVDPGELLAGVTWVPGGHGAGEFQTPGQGV